MTLSWFAAYCSFRSEFRVEQSLRELDIEAYCPTEIKWHRERRIRRVVRWPLLQPYVFVGLKPDAHGDLPFPMVNAIEGVVSLLSSGGKPARLRYDAPSTQTDDGPLTIGEIRAMEDAGQFDFTQDRIVAEKAARLIRKRFSSFADMAKALDEKQAA